MRLGKFDHIGWAVFLLAFICYCGLARADVKQTTTNPFEKINALGDQCFCKLNGEVDDCQCKIEYIDKFNNYRIQPFISNLMQKDYFRFVKVNLKKICQFWPDDARCSLRDCHVKSCEEEELPEKFRKYFLQEELNEKPPADCEQSNPLGQVNDTLSEENLKAFEEWNKHDAAQQDSFCEPDDEALTKADYYDLVKNPERFTGYKDAHAHKIWGAIYKENCFLNTGQPKSPYGPEPEEKCLEKRIFYRLVSGLHTSINVHLCAIYLHKGILGGPDFWGPNVEEFKRRFDPATTWNQGPQWLKNLYFTYLVELRAIAKAAPYLEKELFYAGISQRDDEETKGAVLTLLNAASDFKHHFDETILFRGDPLEAKKLKEEFQLKFRNITKIMDCVGCDKCRLWGKVQTKALGTALKILFSGDSIVEAAAKNNFYLSRSEIVSLFNGFARLSKSISEIENFRDLITKEQTNGSGSKNGEL